ncbi:MAG: hypothetical protein D3920_03090 [Candidatus Electrothrix sp. AW2]|nr:hypothetical protein [Candidatus Electrothrix sp. AX1]MCI5127341.1 hypothetical protein [Candidatus Electrothrix gigas]MCI5134057.1 hypothetical protein [Candidatus Electrothrix gigas]MCI5182551.1 hypothetical protein [Candidatus Electrothrix gigas]
MSGIKEKIENNIVVWMLATLLTGFLSGIATYEGALKIMGLETISKDRLKQLESNPTTPVTNADIYSIPLPDYLNSSEIELMFSKIKSAYNGKSGSDLYQMMGAIGKAQVTEDTAVLQIKPLFESLGKIESGFYVQHQFLGKQGLYKQFSLNFSVKYEKADKGYVTVTVIDDGKSYQIYGMMFNRL